MVRKGLCVALVVVGLAIVTLALVADMVGLGAGDYSFGWDQKLGVVAGMAIAWFAGLHALGWTPRAKDSDARTDDAQVGSSATSVAG